MAGKILPFFPIVGIFIILFGLLYLLFGRVPQGAGQLAVIFSPELTSREMMTAIVAANGRPVRSAFVDNLIILDADDRPRTYRILQKKGAITGFDPVIPGGCLADTRPGQRSTFSR